MLTTTKGSTTTHRKYLALREREMHACEWEISMRNFLQSYMVGASYTNMPTDSVLTKTTETADTLRDLLHNAIQTSDDGITWCNFEPVMQALHYPQITASTCSHITKTKFTLSCDGKSYRLVSTPLYIGNLSLMKESFWWELAQLAMNERLRVYTQKAAQNDASGYEADIDIQELKMILGRHLAADCIDFNPAAENGDAICFSVSWPVGIQWNKLASEITQAFQCLSRLDYQLWLHQPGDRTVTEGQLLSYCFTRMMASREKDYRCDWYEVALKGTEPYYLVVVHGERNRTCKVTIRPCDDNWMISGEVEGLDPTMYDTLIIATGEYLMKKKFQ